MQVLSAFSTHADTFARLAVASRHGPQHSESAAENDAPEATHPTSSGDRDVVVDFSPEAQASLEGQLTEEEQAQVQELKARDAEVRAHEQAHLVAAGPHARGGPTYTYQTGPDGNRYAIGGEVQIDTSPVPDDPEATIRKAQVIRAAASAPAEPSAADRAVAVQATRLEAQARLELREQQQAQASGEPAAGESVPSNSSAAAEPTREQAAVEPASGADPDSQPQTGTSSPSRSFPYQETEPFVGQLLNVLA